MGLENFATREPRALPIFVLADTSGSMAGEKIAELNAALREMVSTLAGADEIRGKFQLCVITFGGSVNVIRELSDIGADTLPELTAGGNTPMGTAFDTVREIIENKEKVSSRSYKPTIVLVSDGLPTDCPQELAESKNFGDWEPLAKLRTSARSSKSQRLALGIGRDADLNMLREFIGDNEIPVMSSGDASGISRFFRWVTMSTVARMSSPDPDSVTAAPPVFDPGSETVMI